jgi:hypothetical protein
MRGSYYSAVVLRCLPVLCASLVGAAIGYVAWGEGRNPVAASLLPLAIAFSGSRLRAFAVGLSYVLATSRAGPSFIATWFDGGISIGIALWFAAGVVGGITWAMGWSAAESPWRKAGASMLAWLIALMPPVAVVAMGHPIVAWGSILPGSAWLGVLASCLVPAALIWALQRADWSQRTTAAALTAVALLATVAGQLQHPPKDTPALSDIVTVSTRWGKPVDEWEILERIERIGQINRRLTDESDVKVVIYPESILDRYSPAIYPILKMEVIDDAARSAQTVVIGTDLPTRSGNLETAAIAYYPDGTTMTALARQTVPIALWKPWKSSGSFVTDWTANNLLKLKEGVTARVIFCYEEYMPVLSLIDEAFTEHTMVLVMANTWASQDPLGSAVQSQHSQGIARLFGRQLLRADNRPKEQARSIESRAPAVD